MNDPRINDTGMDSESTLTDDGLRRSSIPTMSYPLDRSPDDSEDTFLIKCLRYTQPHDGKTNVSITEGEGGKQLLASELESSKAPTISLSNYDTTGWISDRMTGVTDENFYDDDGKFLGAGSWKDDIRYYVELPIPQQISDTNSVTWGADTINMFEMAGVAAAQSAVKSGGGSVLGAVNITRDVLGGKLNIPGMSEEVQTAFRAAVGGKLVNALGSNIDPNSIISRSTGQVMNGNLELLFQGVNLRTFPFDMTFAPRSRKEMFQVKKIIRAFKKSMSAKKGMEGVGRTGLFLSAPDLFLLRYLRRGKDHPFLNTFKPCALTQFNVNYSGAGTYATYGDSTPVNIQVRMTFKEINPIYSEDYDDTDLAGNGVGY
tara:strand:+ start:166 stop:1284 length:1119 start_codon:yes stop_codon:yes gene_type:complete